MSVVMKPWGYEEILIDEPDRCLKRLTVWPGRRTSKQRHERKDETMVAIAGTPYLLRWIDPLSCAGDLLASSGPVRIPPGIVHRLEARGHLPAVVLEISGPRDDEDVVRLQDDYGRAGD